MELANMPSVAMGHIELLIMRSLCGLEIYSKIGNLSESYAWTSAT
jgi:hypothetical protein